jgi:hypothetical protein
MKLPSSPNAPFAHSKYHVAPGRCSEESDTSVRKFLKMAAFSVAPLLAVATVAHVFSYFLLNSVSLEIEMHKPFDGLVKGPFVISNRGNRIRTCDLLDPNQAL